MNMKKFSALLLALSMVLSLAGLRQARAPTSPPTIPSPAAKLPPATCTLAMTLTPGENYYGPYYDDWSEKTDDELYEEALTEDTTINVYATSSKMMKVEESFEETYPGP